MRIFWTAIPGAVWTSRRFTAHSEPARLPAPQPLTRRGGAPSWLRFWRQGKIFWCWLFPAVLAAQELGSRYPARTIRVVDTLCASMGQGLLIYHAVQRQRAGESLEQVTDFVEANKLHLCHWFTVDDLMFLKRGGRISAATAVMGTMLKIKPVLHVDDLGHLVNVSKARGRRASIDAMAAKVGQTGIDPGNQVFFISHGDCLEDAKYLADSLRRTYHPKDVVIGYVGPVIGSHSGPGTLALFFLGSQR